MYNRRMAMRIYTGGELLCNGYLLKGENNEYVAIDAPQGFAAWALRTLPAGAKLTHLLITHQHFDHIADVAELQETTGCCVHACMPYHAELTLAENARAWGITPPKPFRVDDVIGERDTHAEWAGLAWEALHVPGHSPDSMVYALPERDELYAGDVLFEGSVGRTDFPGGSATLLAKGIRSKIMTRPPETAVYAGHGPATSVGNEKLNNPFIQG